MLEQIISNLIMVAVLVIMQLRNTGLLIENASADGAFILEETGDD